jgi:hypothetical protein
MIAIVVYIVMITSIELELNVKVRIHYLVAFGKQTHYPKALHD